MSLFAARMSALGTENAFKVGADIARAERAGRDVVRLNLGEPDFDSPDVVEAAAIEQIRAGNSHYCDPAGIRSLREAIAEHVERTRNLDVTPDRVIVTPGAKMPIASTMLAYVEPGDEVVYPSPGYPVYESWVTYVGARPVPLHLEESTGFALRAEDLARLVGPRTKLVILNSPSNPTGGVLAHEDLEGIAEVIRRQGSPELRIYSDEVYEHIVFDGRRHLSIASIDGMAQRTILVSGFSKSFAMTGWRLGYAVLPSVAEAEAYKQLNINLISCVPPFIQEAGVVALTSEESFAQTARMVEAFAERRDVAVEGLNSIPGVSCTRPGGAFYAFPNVGRACAELGVLDTFYRLPGPVRVRTTPSTLLQMFLLFEHGVATMDRRSFGAIGCEGQHYLRLSLATDLARLREGVERIRRGLADRVGFERFASAGRNLS